MWQIFSNTVFTHVFEYSQQKIQAKIKQDFNFGGFFSHSVFLSEKDSSSWKLESLMFNQATSEAFLMWSLWGLIFSICGSNELGCFHPFIAEDCYEMNGEFSLILLVWF